MSLHVWILSAGMLLCGAFNTISTKKQDLIVVGHTWSGEKITYYHPVVQSACMFLGEFLCLLPYAAVVWWKRAKKRRAAASQRLVEVPDLTEPFLLTHHALRPEAAARIASANQTVKKIFAFAIPTLCDALTTTLMNVGLYYTSASVYQMLRGTLVFFAGILTMIILKRRLYLHHWQGMLLIMVGAAVVGVASIIFSDCDGRGDHGDDNLPPDLCVPGAALSCGLLHIRAAGRRLWPHLLGSAAVRGSGSAAGSSKCTSAKNPLLGNTLVIAAQVFAALQFIIEEKYVSQFHMPALLAVGLEGFWGLILSCLALPAFHFIQGPDGYPLDDVRLAFQDFLDRPELQLWVISSILSIATFNFFGISVTKKLSGASRATIDACRTILVWTYSLYVGWEHFYGIQILGYVILVSGTTLYNELMASCLAQPAERSERNGERRSTPYGHAPMGVAQRAAPVLAGRPSDSLGSSAPYDMARSLRISRAQLSPHSIGSMGGHLPDLSPPLSEAWGSPIAPGSLTPRGQPRRIGEPGPGSHAFSLYDVWYSGMDVSPERPPGRPLGARNPVGHPTPRKSPPPPQANSFSTPISTRVPEEQPLGVPEFSFGDVGADNVGLPPPQFGMLSTMRQQLEAAPQSQPSPSHAMSAEVSPSTSFHPGASVDNLESNMSQEDDDSVFGPMGRLSTASSGSVADRDTLVPRQLT